MFDLSPLKNALNDIIFGVPFERDFHNAFVLPQMKRPERGNLLIREMQLKNQQATDTLTGEWARYPEDRFWNELRYMYEKAGFPLDANRIKKEYDGILKERKEGQAARARKEAIKNAQKRKEEKEATKTATVLGEDWIVETGSGDPERMTTPFEKNPKFRGHGEKPYLCDKEFDYIACPPMNVPTLFEEKALKFKTFWLTGKTVQVAYSNLGKGYGTKLGKYYFDMFEECSEQRPSPPS